MSIKKSVVAVRWGAMSMVTLYLSVVSGLVLSLQYDPAAPYYSASGLDILIPFGTFWRSLHFYSSQLFFLLSVFHLVAVVLDGAHASLSFRNWRNLVFSLFVSLLLLFTGYVLRADVTGASAGRIAENIVLSIPLLGRFLNSLLFSMAEDGMKRVYANHLVGLGVLWLFLSWAHLRRYRVHWRQHPVLAGLLLLFAAIFAAPMEPERTGVFHINGPWFFIGLQELLRHLQPFWAAVVWPSLFAASLLALHRSGPWSRRASLLAGFWLALYAGLTIIGLNR